MRLCTSLPLCLAAAVSLPGPAHAAAHPTCAGPDDSRFPITSRIHGGPDSYQAGGGPGTFLLDLTNTTSRTCAAIHPVIVLVDAKHTLKATQPRLEFYDGPRTHPVRFETTDRAELVGPFDAGLPGFTVGPGRTVTVRVRMSITADAVADDVTAKAAVVQRHNDDGDWVGQSNDYRFRIAVGPNPLPDRNPNGTPDRDSDPAPDSAPAAEPQDTDPAATPTASDSGLPFADELAGTGLGTPLGVLTATALLLATGGAVVLTRRRR